MPDVQEVFRMATQKVRPDPGALQRQLRGQRSKTLRRKAGALALVAVLAAVAVVVALSSFLDGAPSDRTGGVRTIDEPTMTVPGVGGGFSADGRWLFGGIESSEGRILDASTGQVLQTVVGAPGDGVIGFSADGTHFMTGHGGDASETYTDVYRTDDGELVHRFRGACCFGAFSTDGTLVALPSHGSTRVYTTEGRRITLTDAPIGGVAFSPDHEQLVLSPCCGGEEAGVSAYVGSIREPGWGDFVTLEGDSGRDAAWSPDGSLIATISDDRLTVWSAEGTLVVAIDRSQFPSLTSFTSVEFGPGGRIATGISGGATVWELSDGGLRQIASVDHGGRLIGVALDPAGDRLMTTNGTDTKVWDIGI